MQKTQEGKRKQIGNYSYNSQDVLGKGYSSVVYKGVDSSTKQQVAIKAIQTNHKKDQIHLKMIKTQIKVLNALRNQPHIVNLLDIQQTDHHTYIITQFCEKGTLKRYIEKKRGLSQQEALSIFTQVFIGYQSINKASIIHRDIKPANILMLKNDQIKIADFGFAIPVSQLSTEESLIIGSPMYMPYEALKKRIYTLKGDIWALGITLYEMLSGQSPFKAKTQKQLIRQINYGSIHKLIPKRFSEKTQLLLTRMLQFDKDTRAGVEELRQIIFGKQLIPNVLKTMKNLQRDKTRDNIQQSVSKGSKSQSQSTKQDFPQKNKPYRASEKCQGIFIKQRQTSIEKQKIKQRAMTLKMDCLQGIKDNKTNQINVDKCKQISHQLICQIHFCRFAYKLLNRMLKVNSESISQQLKNQMMGIIFKKLEEAEKLTFVSSDIINQYRNSKYYKEIQNIVGQYKTRYNQQIKKINKTWISYQHFQKSIEGQILKIYEQIKELSDPSAESDIIIILDYMITLKQLCKLLQKDDLGQFYRNSKIEKIVEGVPSKNITADHIKAIKNKLKGIKLI